MSRILLGGDRRFGYAELEKLTWDTRVLDADTMIPVLAQEVAARDLPSPRRERALLALKFLEDWDRRTHVASPETTLYFFWRHAMVRRGMQDPVAAFEFALNHMESTYGGWQVAWGEVNRLQRRHTGGNEPFDDEAPSLPVGGGPGDPFGTIFNFYALPREDKQRMYGFQGHSYVALVEFANPPKAKSILVFGASSDPASPHYFDQAKLFVDRRYKPAWFDRTAVGENVRTTLTLQFDP